MTVADRYRAIDGGLSGFTLLEMLVVLAIMGILAAVVPRLGNGNSGPHVRSAADVLAADLRLLRDDAERRQSVTTLTLASGAYVLNPAGRKLTLPAGIVATLHPDEPALVGSAADRIGFYPDGSSSGGTITLRAGAAEVTIVVRWLDGMVMVRG